MIYLQEQKYNSLIYNSLSRLLSENDNTRIITEAFNLKNGTFRSKNNQEYKIVYIDPTTSDNTYQYKEVLKKYNAKFFNTLKSWGWFVDNNEVYTRLVKPCLEELNKVSQNKTSQDDIIGMIDLLISEFNSGNIAKMETMATSESEIKSKLQRFKEDLVSSYDSEEFMSKLEPIIKFNQSLGHKYSLLNTILIYIQDPKASNVKSRTTWNNFNREVKPNAPAIYLWRPKTKQLNSAEKSQITQEYLRKFKAKSVDDLNPGQKDQLRVALSGSRSEVYGYALYPAFDVRYTDQIPDTEDLVGSSKTSVDWYDKDETETEFIESLINAVTELIKENNITLNYQDADSLGGALGVSQSGTIGVIKDSPNAKHTLNTLIHEFAHEILHQKYLRTKNDKEWANFFIGTAQGREAVEQQAEITAWGVMKFFGIASNTNINYAVMWGMQDKTVAVSVFDEVARVISKLINLITDKLVSKDNL